MNADEIIRELELSPHPEGGFFRETFRGEALPFALPERGERSASTAIYFLLRAGDFSALHAVTSDEAWHHYLGSPGSHLELHLLDRMGTHTRCMLGTDLRARQVPQYVVPKGVLQAARVVGPADAFVLAGCTVAPGFDFADFTMPSRAALLAQFPAHSDFITSLTRA